MKKAEIIKMLVSEFDFVAHGGMEYERILDQCFGFVKGFTRLNNEYYEDITECWEMFRAAIHPFYKTDYTEFKETYKKYYDFWRE